MMEQSFFLDAYLTNRFSARVNSRIQGAINLLASPQPLGERAATQLWLRAAELADAISEGIRNLPADDRIILRDRVEATTGFGLGGLDDFFGDLVTPLVPEGSFPTPDEVVTRVSEKLEGISSDSLIIVRDVFENIPVQTLDVINQYLDRIQVAGELVTSGKIDSALATMFEATVIIGRDLGEAVVSIAADIINDLLCGVLAGNLLGRPLSRGERTFAHEIFGNRIRLTGTRIVTRTLPRGMVAANVIFMPSMNLADDNIRATFAHELTHIYQDQQPFAPDTSIATSEQLNHYLGSHRDPYDVTLVDSTTWNQLGVEAQAQVVANWQNHLDGGNVVPFAEINHYRRIFADERLFEWK